LVLVAGGQIRRVVGPLAAVMCTAGLRAVLVVGIDARLGSMNNPVAACSERPYALPHGITAHIWGAA
jgi:hypothetical protein